MKHAATYQRSLELTALGGVETLPTVKEVNKRRNSMLYDTTIANKSNCVELGITH